MSDNLIDLHRDARMRANEENLIEFWSYVCHRPPTEFVRANTACRFFTGLSTPYFNGVIGGKFDNVRGDEEIGMIIGEFRARGLPFSWWIPRSPLPVDLGIRLERRGFHNWSNPPAMSFDLSGLEDSPLPVGARIREIATDEDIKVWIDLALKGFDMPDLGREMFEIEKHLGREGAPHYRRYLGFLYGEAVATSAVFLGAGVAGLYVVSTVPHARGRGMGTGMTLAPLHWAREAGYRLAILQASSMGYPIYKRIGFQEDFQYGYYEYAAHSHRE